MAKQSKSAAKAGSLPSPLNKSETMDVYASRRFLGAETQRKLGLRIGFDVYYKDPLVAKDNPGLEIDEDFFVPWEARIDDGPTSARFAVVDYDSTANKLQEPARWDPDEKAFFDPKDRKIDRKIKDTAQFRQVSTWAILQNTLDFFESPHGLGRRIAWGFEGNRLLVVPDAGYGENAYYDRQSKSLQFYYFDDNQGERVHTCLSSDIVNHEFGHALLDGIRPYYLEAVSAQTGAFHEFLGDLNAILMTLGNASFRQALAEKTEGDLSSKSGSNLLADVAAQFGKAVDDQPYLRSARNQEKLGAHKDELRPHTLSEVMTGTMFDVIVALTQQYMVRPEERGTRMSPASAYNFTFRRMQVIAIQSLDLLPPVEVTFNDYARAVLRNLEIADPTDPNGYRKIIADIFVDREILMEDESVDLLKPHPLLDRPPGVVFHDPAVIASSPAEAYRYLDDNRDQLFIPDNVDIIVPEVFTAEKMAGPGLRQPKQIILQYLWREELVLEGKRFGAFAGQTTSLLCGATLVLDENGSMLSWMRKPGSEPCETASRGMIKQKAGKKLFGTEEAAIKEMQEGKARREAYLDALARRIDEGMIGEALGGATGLVSETIPPLTSRSVDGSLRFELTPHFGVDHHDDDDSLRGLQWKTSS